MEVKNDGRKNIGGGGRVTSSKRSAHAVGCMMDACSEEPAKSNDLYCNQNFHLSARLTADGQSITRVA